ncbi:hypothetical protein MIMGU_mgv1a0123771mg, partial [Erythranthe guttata]
MTRLPINGPYFTSQSSASLISSSFLFTFFPISPPTNSAAATKPSSSSLSLPCVNSATTNATQFPKYPAGAGGSSLCLASTAKPKYSGSSSPTDSPAGAADLARQDHT